MYLSVFVGVERNIFVLNTEKVSVKECAGGSILELKKYVNNILRVEVTQKGQRVEGCELTPIGDIILPKRVTKEEKTQPFTVVYEDFPLPLGLDIINTSEGLAFHLEDMESLDLIRQSRTIAYRKFNIPLKSFVIWNALVFDSLGHTLLLKYADQENWRVGAILELEEFREIISQFSQIFTEIPTSNSRCKHCGQKWTPQTLRDVVKYNDELYHQKCNEFARNAHAMQLYERIAKEVFDSKYWLHAIKNEYGSEAYRGCWCIIQTSFGSIRIGWRKRVLEIEWLTDYETFDSEVFKDEKVTKDFRKRRYIHADTVDIAVEYLQRVVGSHKDRE